MCFPKVNGNVGEVIRRYDLDLAESGSFPSDAIDKARAHFTFLRERLVSLRIESDRIFANGRYGRGWQFVLYQTKSGSVMGSWKRYPAADRATGERRKRPLPSKLRSNREGVAHLFVKRGDLLTLLACRQLRKAFPRLRHELERGERFVVHSKSDTPESRGSWVCAYCGSIFPSDGKAQLHCQHHALAWWTGERFEEP